MGFKAREQTVQPRRRPCLPGLQAARLRRGAGLPLAAARGCGVAQLGCRRGAGGRQGSLQAGGALGAGQPLHPLSNQLEVVVNARGKGLQRSF